MTEPADSSGHPEQPPPPRRRRRRWPYVIGGLLVLLVVLVLLGPTILSTGAGRALLVPRINAYLNGRMHVDDWSFGWTSGTRVDGLMLYDDQGRLVLEVPRLRTDVTILDALRGRYHLGETVIDALIFGELAVDPQGRTNLHDVLRIEPEPPRPEEPVEWPDVAGSLKIGDIRGTIIVAGAPQAIHLDGGSVALNIPSLRDPITHAVDLLVRVGAAETGTIRSSGVIDLQAADPLDQIREASVLLDLPELAPIWAFIVAMIPHDPAQPEAELPQIHRGALAANISIAREQDVPVVNVEQLSLRELQLTHGEAGVELAELSMQQRGGVREGLLGLSGGGFVNALRITQNGEPVFTENRVELANKFSLDHAAQVLMIENFLLAMRTSEALELTAAGTIAEWQTARRFEQLQIAAAYDLEALRSLLEPFLPEGMEELELRGRERAEFVLNGSYPADMPPTQAIRHLLASGRLPLPWLEFRGLAVEQFDLPVQLSEGVITLADVPPAVCNEGTLHLPHTQIDVTEPHPRLTMAAGHVLQGITLNPVFAQHYLGEYINPVFVDPEEARGLLDLHVEHCERIPLSDLIAQQVRENDGRAEVVFSVREVNIGRRGLDRLIGRNHIVGEIPEARIVIADGRARHSMRLQIERYGLGFDGNLRLEDQFYDQFHVVLPPEHMPSWLRDALQRDLLRFLPDPITIPFSGPITDLRPERDFIPRLVEEAARRQIAELIPRPREREPDPEQPNDREPRPDPLRELRDRLRDLDPLRRDRESPDQPEAPPQQ